MLQEKGALFPVSTSPHVCLVPSLNDVSCAWLTLSSPVADEAVSLTTMKRNVLQSVPCRLCCRWHCSSRCHCQQ